MQSVKKALKQIVKNEIHCAATVSVLTKKYSGNVDMQTSNDRVDRVFTNSNRAGGNDTGFAEFDMQWTPYNTKRLLDAASVLYNGKTPAVKISGTNFDYKLLQADFLYASYKIVFINHQNVPIEMDMYEVTYKSNSNTAFLDAAKQGLSQQKFVTGGDPTFTVVGTTNFGYIMDLGLEFTMIESLSKSFAIKKLKTKKLLPGKTASYFSKMPASCCDFSKRVLADGTTLASYAKGDKQLVIRVRPVLMPVSANGGTNFVPQRTLYGQVGNWGLLTEVTEVYKIAQPDITADAYNGAKRCFVTDYAEQYGEDVVQTCFYQGDTEYVTNPSA
jgi:hypothetical protein